MFFKISIFLFGFFTNKVRKLKVAESSQAKASFTKPWIATDEPLAGRLRAIRPTLVGYVLLMFVFCDRKGQKY